MLCWVHVGSGSGATLCESSSEKKLMLRAVLRSDVGHESLALIPYQRWTGKLRAAICTVDTRGGLMCPCSCIRKMATYAALWPPHRCSFILRSLPQRRRTPVYSDTRAVRNMPKLTERPLDEQRARRPG